MLPGVLLGAVPCASQEHISPCCLGTSWGLRRVRWAAPPGDAGVAALPNAIDAAAQLRAPIWDAATRCRLGPARGHQCARSADSAQLCDGSSVLSRDSRMNDVVAEAEQEVSEGNIKDIRLSQAHGRDDRARGPTKVHIRIKDQA